MTAPVVRTLDIHTGTSRFAAYINGTRDVLDQMASSDELRESVLRCATLVINCFNVGGKLLFAGNGGSAADAQHMAAEYVSRFMYDRPSLPAIAITTDTSIMTAIGNDYGFKTLFSRQLQALAQPEDVFICYSTSGTSENILLGLAEAKRRGLTCIGFTGSRSAAMQTYCDALVAVPSSSTPKIQEGHLVLGHFICGLVEQTIYPPEPA
jgi:D-sedoheptulose 7-phosphate isomerase